MTSKEYVLTVFPTAGVVQFNGGRKKKLKKDRYFVVFKDPTVIPLLILSDNRLGKGKTEYSAWVESKNTCKQL